LEKGADKPPDHFLRSNIYTSILEMKNQINTDRITVDPEIN